MNTVEKWSVYLTAERRFSPLTVRAYTDDLKAFISYTQAKEFDPLQITFNDLRSYIMLLMERGDNPKSTNRRISALKSYFKYLVRSGIVEKDPTAKLRTIPQQTTLPEFITQKKGEQIIKTLLEWSDDPTQRRNALMVILLLTTGMRRAEIASLSRENVDIAQQKIKVMGKGSKEREIPLLPQVCSLVEQYLHDNSCENGENCLFLTNKCKPITTQDVYTVVRDTLREAGVQGKQSPHVLRHTFATHLMAQGASLRSIQELLGHASLSSTEIYTHNTIERLQESYRNAHPRAKNE